MTKTPSPLSSLEKQLRDRFSDARMSIDAPSQQDATWHLDINRNGHTVLIQWRKGHGFGISASREHSYGEGADELYEDIEAAYARTVSLLLSQSFTAPPEAVRLGELRKQRGVSQVQLASMLNIQQGAVSKLERRNDMLLSTIRDVVCSMGGTLRLIATFPDGMEKSIELEDSRAEVNAPEKIRQTPS